MGVNTWVTKLYMKVPKINENQSITRSIQILQLMKSAQAQASMTRNTLTTPLFKSSNL